MQHYFKNDILVSLYSLEFWSDLERNIMAIKLYIRKILGIILISIGLFLSSATIDSINDVGRMGGPMAISLFPFIEIFFLTVGLLLLYLGAIISKIPTGKVLLLLSIVSSWLVIRHTWLYPTIDGAYYLLRFGRDFADSYYVPDDWQHVLAFTCTGTLLYFGITKTFHHVFSDESHSIEWQFGYHVLLCIFSVSIVFLSGWIYNFFNESLISGAISDSQRHMNTIKTCLMPLCLILLSCGLKKYKKFALVFMISGVSLLILIGITFSGFSQT